MTQGRTIVAMLHKSSTARRCCNPDQGPKQQRSHINSTSITPALCDEPAGALAVVVRA